tara:strand:+ start:1200 stop:1751 length:552 start_codon:yes stop_codon:yes gene_type:complete
MALREIVNYGNPILRKKVDPIKDIAQVNKVIDDMFDSMYEADGIGLAANQVGLDMNLFIIDITHTEEAKEPNIFINSEIISKNGQKEIYQEGCLSLPGIALDVLRPENVELKYQTMDGNWHQQVFSGLLSRAIQHEMDHLNGVFIIDRVSEVERIKYKKALDDLKKISKKQIKNQLNKKGFIL